MSFNRITPVLIALLVAVLAGCSVSTDPATLIAKAQTFRQKGDYASAIIELRNALQANPENAEARYLLGTAYLESGEAAFATVELQKALTGGYDPKKVLPDLAKSLIVQEKFKEALEATDPASVPSAQGSPEIMTIRAYAQILSKQLAAGKASLDLAMVLRPDYPDALLLQARIALGERDTEKATTLVDRAIAVDPKNVDAWILKAALERQSAHPDQARISLQKAIEINQRSAAARIELASLEIENKRYEDAARELEALREIAPKNVMGLYLQALLELRTGNNKAAVETAYRAMELAPKHVPSTLLAGIAELAMGNPEKAKKYLSTALEIDSRNVYGRKMLAATQMKSGQYGQAIATLEPILDQSASDPQLLALAGEAYMQNKQFAKATQYFEKAAALDPRNAATRISLGLSRMAMGANDRAMADLEAASALGTGGARADITLATIHIQRKEFDQALKVIAKLEKTQPNNAVLYNMKATAYAGKGDTAQARAQYERALQIAPTFLPAASNLAQLDLQAGNVAAARKRYESVLEKDKKQVPAMLALADVISRTRGPEKDVLDWIQKAKAAAPDAKEPVRAEIEHYRRTGQLDKALAIAIEQKKVRPGDPEVLEVVGKLLIAKGLARDAVAVYGDRAVLLPNSPEAQLDFANAQLHAKDPLGASNTLRKVLRLKPGYPEAQALLVSAELAQDRAVRALQVAREVQTDLPKAPLGYVLEGDVLMATKKPAQAAVLYEKGYAVRKSGLVAIKVHDAWYEAGKPEIAEARIKEWLAANPDDITTRRHLAYARLLRGKYAGAVEQYKIVLERQPKDPVALNNLAWALSKLKDPSAVTYAQRAYELTPADGGIADTYAQILVERGELPRGIEILQKAVAATPSNPEIRYHLAQAFAKSGDKPKAISQLEIVIGSSPKFAQEAEAIALLKQMRQ